MLRRRGAACFQFDNGDEVDHRGAGLQERCRIGRNATCVAPKDVSVETAHGVDVPDAQDDVVDFCIEITCCPRPSRHSAMASYHYLPLERVVFVRRPHRRRPGRAARIGARVPEDLERLRVPT